MVYESLHEGGEEQHHAGAAEGRSALLLLLHRVARLQVWIHKAQGQPVGVFPLQAEDKRTASDRSSPPCVPHLRDLRLDRLPLQQSLVEQLVELLLVLLSINHPFSQVAQPKSSPRVRKRRIHHLEWHKVTHDNGTPKRSSCPTAATMTHAEREVCRHKNTTITTITTRWQGCRDPPTTWLVELVQVCTCVTLVSSSSGSSGVVQAVLMLPLHSVVLISCGEFPLEEVTDNFWKVRSANVDSELETIRLSSSVLQYDLQPERLTTPLMAFFPAGPLGSTTRYVSMPRSLR